MFRRELVEHVPILPKGPLSVVGTPPPDNNQPTSSSKSPPASSSKRPRAKRGSTPRPPSWFTNGPSTVLAPRKIELTANVMQEAFVLLDQEIGKSEFLSSLRPIQCVSAGGSVAVTCAGIRLTTPAVEIMVEPYCAQQLKVHPQELGNAVRRVADILGLAQKAWLDDGMTGCVRPDRRPMLFQISARNQRLLYHGENLHIFVAHLEWAFERKARDYAYPPPHRRVPRADDLADAVALLYSMQHSSAWMHQPLPLEYLRALNFNGTDPELDLRILELIGKRYEETYDEEGIVEDFWDDDIQMRKYKTKTGVWHIRSAPWKVS